MTTAIDTNVLSAFWLNELDSALLSSALNRCRAEGPLVISPFVYSELLACPGMSEGLLRTFANGIGMKIDFTIEERVWTEAGTSYHRHSRRDRVLPSAPPRRILADFLIGATPSSRPTASSPVIKPTSAVTSPNSSSSTLPSPRKLT